MAVSWQQTISFALPETGEIVKSMVVSADNLHLLTSANDTDYLRTYSKDGTYDATLSFEIVATVRFSAVTLDPTGNFIFARETDWEFYIYSNDGTFQSSWEIGENDFFSGFDSHSTDVNGLTQKPGVENRYIVAEDYDFDDVYYGYEISNEDESNYSNFTAFSVTQVRTKDLASNENSLFALDENNVIFRYNASLAYVENQSLPDGVSPVSAIAADGENLWLADNFNFYTSVMGEVAVISDVAIPRQLHLLDKSQFIRYFDIASGDAGETPTLVKAVNIPALVQTAIDFSKVGSDIMAVYQNLKQFEIIPVTPISSVSLQDKVFAHVGDADLEPATIPTNALVVESIPTTGDSKNQSILCSSL